MFFFNGKITTPDIGNETIENTNSLINIYRLLVDILKSVIVLHELKDDWNKMIGEKVVIAVIAYKCMVGLKPYLYKAQFNFNRFW